MGVRGLTSYVNKRNSQFFEDYKLRNCRVVIDGAALSSVLYIDLTKSNSVLGGDYDKYAKAVEKCFRSFRQCKVEPIVVLDGGYERKKFTTVKKRKAGKMISLLKVQPSSSSRARSCFPLMMRQVFKDVLLEMNVIVVQSDFEADSEIAALARCLDCPVLSQDSDFLIYDVLYIPLSMLSFEVCTDSQSEKYLWCKIYSVENLLDSFGGLSKEMLPLLATLLGNDYISRRNFKDFFSNVKLEGGKRESKSIRQIGGFLNWLRKETFESAVSKILSHLKKKDRKLIAYRMKKSIRGYTKMETPLAAYLPPSIAEIIKKDQGHKLELEQTVEREVEASEILEVESHEAQYSGDEVNYGDIDEASSEEESFEEYEAVEFATHQPVPNWLLDEARKGNIHPSVMTILGMKIFFFVPQIEDSSLPHAGASTVSILAHLAGLLVGDTCIDYWSRDKFTYRKTQLTPITSTKDYGSFPSLPEIVTLSLNDRRSIFTSILGIGSNIVEGFPDDWKIFILSLIYWCKNAVLQAYHIHAVLIMAVIIRSLDVKIGYYRNKPPFFQCYNSKLKAILKSKIGETTQSKSNQADQSVEEAFMNVTIEDCIVIFEDVVPYFCLDHNILARPRLFSRTLVHYFTDFQVCIDMINILNGVLLSPYPHCKVANFYNSIFLYNFASNFKKRTNIPVYIETFFTKAPTLRNLYKTIFEALVDLFPKSPAKIKKKKKPKVKPTVTVIEENNSGQECHEQSDKESFIDENNCYSLLNNLAIN